MKDNFRLKKIDFFAENPGEHFALKISTNQRFGTYAGKNSVLEYAFFWHS